MSARHAASPGAWPRSLAWLLLVGASVHAQVPLDGFVGPAAGGGAGAALAWIGDVDGDGVDDVIVGAPGDSAGGAWAGAAYLLSGADFSPIFSWTGHAPGDQFGASVASAGDVDADGVDDVIVGAPQDPFDAPGWAGSGPGYAQVFSGATGAVLHTWQGEASPSPHFASFGRAVLGAGDLNRDGHADLAVAEREGWVETLHGEQPVGGRIRVFSGADGSLLATLTVPSIANGHLGWSLAGGFDLDGDDTPDLVIGAPLADRVVAVSGATGALLVTFGTTQVRRGYSVAVLGDVDGDGVPDVVAGLSDGAEVYSGATGTLIRSTGSYGSQGQWKGVIVARVPDADGDGVDDYAVGAPAAAGVIAPSGKVHVFSGATGEMLASIVPAAGGVELGSAVAGGVPPQADGQAALLVGAPASDGPGGARAGFAGLWSSRGARLYRSVYSPLTVDTDFGSRVASVGDVNNDGWGDIAVGLPHDSSVFPSGGRVVVFSGKDGALLHDFPAIGNFYRLGWSVGAAGDIDGDGHADVVAGAPYPTAQTGKAFARVWSGRDGSVLLHHVAVQNDQLGVAVAGLGDLDGDGTPDLAFGAPNDTSIPGSVGRVHVISGATGALLFDVRGPSVPSEFGSSLAAAGDVNSDGVPDLVIGARYANTPNGAASGLVLVVSGADGSTLHEFHGPGQSAHAGWTVAGVGDLNHDGAADVAIGIPGAAPLAGFGPGVVELRSGADGSLLHALRASAGSGATGRAVAPAGDVDGDGTPDVALGLSLFDDLAPGSGVVRVFSGATGAVVASWSGLASGNQAGHAISGGFDVDNDGAPDLVVGALGSVQHPAPGGGVHVVRPVPVESPWQSLGHVLPGSAGPPSLLGDGPLLAGEAVTLSLAQAAPNSSAALALGSSVLGAPFKGGVLVPHPLLIVTGLPTGPAGALTIGGPWPAGLPSGFTFVAQAWIVDAAGPAGFAASNAVAGVSP